MAALVTPIQYDAGSPGQANKEKEVNDIDQRGKNKIASICRQLIYKKKAPKTIKFSEVM